MVDTSLRGMVDNSVKDRPFERPSKRRRIDGPREEDADSEVLSQSIPPDEDSEDDEEWPEPPQSLCFRHRVDYTGPKLRRIRSEGCLRGCIATGSSSIEPRRQKLQDFKPLPPKPRFSFSIESAEINSQGCVQPTRAVIDVTSTNYRRDVLQPNRVFLHNVLNPLPSVVAAVVEKVVFSHSTSDIDETTASMGREDISGVVDDCERTLRLAFSGGILPGRKSGDPVLSLAREMPFLQAILPRPRLPHLHRTESLSRAQAIFKPRTSLSYGYLSDAFTCQQDCVLEEFVNWVRLRKYACPGGRDTSDHYWPYFTILFQSLPDGGNLYVGENHCAAAGSACLLAIGQLYALASDAGAMIDPSDYVTYSMTIDGRTAVLMVHWLDMEENERTATGDRRRFNVQTINVYNLRNLKDIQDLHTHASNIVEWGLGQRLNQIRNALDVINDCYRLM